MDSLQPISGSPTDYDQEQDDPKKNIRETINLILPDSLMILLAIIMLPVVLIPLLFNLPDSIDTTFQFIDYTILGIFIIEYFSKLIFAPSILKHFLNPWHLLDLFVILVPFVGLLPFIPDAVGTSSPILRLLRIIRIAVVGGRAVDRKRHLAPAYNIETVATEPLLIQIMDGTPAKNYDNIPLNQLKGYLSSPTPTWVNISSVSENDLDQLSSDLDIPKIILESELIEESYPRVDYFDNYSLIFARIADVQITQKGAARLLINRSGILIVCKGQNIISISKTKNDLFNQIVVKARRFMDSDDPVVVTILHTILKYILEKDKQIITALEQELMVLESIPLNKRPSNFLETTFYFRKEVNQLVPSLLHLKEIISVITSKRVPLEGFEEDHEKIFDILADEATYLYETASNARDNLQSLVDLYINTNSFQTNKVMRIIAVITSMSIIPALMGLLGSNIVGNPWDIHLWQVFAILAIIMLSMFWIFYRLGWLKG
jgi:Mg2+ and Co2+ transporter CorA